MSAEPKNRGAIVPSNNNSPNEHFDTKLSDLPDEIIKEIMVRLKKETQSLLNFASTCHRYLRSFQQIHEFPNGFGLHYGIKWRETQENYCGICHDPESKSVVTQTVKFKDVGLISGMMYLSRRRRPIKRKSPDDESPTKSSFHLCFDDLLNRKLIKYSKLTFHEGDSDIETLKCLDKAFSDALASSNRLNVLHNIERLVELELIYINHDFLCKVMNHLTGVKHLIANYSCFTILNNTKIKDDSRRLNMLTIYLHTWELNENNYGRKLVEYYRPRILNFDYLKVSFRKKNYMKVQKLLQTKGYNYSVSDLLVEHFDLFDRIYSERPDVSTAEIIASNKILRYIKTNFKNVELRPWVSDSAKNSYSFGYELKYLPNEEQKLDDLLNAFKDLCKSQYNTYRCREY